MPFCMAEILIVIIIIISISQIVTLQVRIPNKTVATHFLVSHDRKAFLSVPASMTLEAAMVLSLLIFASLCMILPMKIMNTGRRIQAGLEAVGEDFSRYAYIQDALKRKKEFALTGADDFTKGFCHHLAAGAAEGYAQVRVMEHMDTRAIQHVTMLRSRILEDGEHFDLILDYRIRMPFPVPGISDIACTARCRRRAWIGKEGKDWDKNGNGSGADDEIVYVGKGSTRYHCSRTCHYLSNDLSAVPFEQIGEKRNHNGGKYYACAVCGKQGAGKTVYILPSGSSYHTTRNCTAIQAYVRAVRKSEVEYLGPCSYCGQKR